MGAPITLTTAGESHGPAVTAIVAGIPAGLAVTAAAIARDMQRRQVGYGRGGRMRIESDRVEIVGGIRHGLTLGSPVCLVVANGTGRTGGRRCRPRSQIGRAHV